MSGRGAQMYKAAADIPRHQGLNQVQRGCLLQRRDDIVGELIGRRSIHERNWYVAGQDIGVAVKLERDGIASILDAGDFNVSSIRASPANA